MVANSTYATGTNDTATTLVNNVSPTDTQQMNGVASAAVQIETILGAGTTLKGTAADLVARLAIEHNADGTQKTITVDKGGTGNTALTAQKVLIGDGTNSVLLGLGLLYHGPSSMGSGSTAGHEGNITIAANQALSGIHFYADFTINAGIVATIDSGAQRLVIVATGTITINGTIEGTGKGINDEPARRGLAMGFSQAGGGGVGGSGGGVGQPGYSGRTIYGGASAAGSGTGGTPAQASSTNVAIDHPYAIYGGGPGGSGGTTGTGLSTTGGVGGASVVLVAPTVVLGASSVINTSGLGGENSSGTKGASGGGGAGNFYVFARQYTDNGCTFTMTGGVGGTNNGTGGAGAAGVKQINLYA